MIGQFCSMQLQEEVKSHPKQPSCKKYVWPPRWKKIWNTRWQLICNFTHMLTIFTLIQLLMCRWQNSKKIHLGNIKRHPGELPRNLWPWYHHKHHPRHWQCGGRNSYHSKIGGWVQSQHRGTLQMKVKQSVHESHYWKQPIGQIIERFYHNENNKGNW